MRLLSLDIETIAHEAYVWQLFDQNVGLNQIIKPGKVICWAAKFKGDTEIVFRKHTDGDFLAKMWSMLDEADCILTYNGKRFDIPHLNREFLLAGFTPPSPYKHIDLFHTIRRVFKFASGKLAHVSDQLQIGQKMEHEGFPLWVKCMEEDAAAWRIMKRYNCQDVRLLERLYNKLLPWLINSPNHNLYGKTGVCSRCGSKHLQRRGTYKTQTCIYTRLHCQSCGAWSRTRFTEVNKDERHKIYTGVQL